MGDAVTATPQSVNMWGTGASVGTAICLLGLLGFTIFRMFTLNNGRSSTTEIDSSTALSVSVIFPLAVIALVLYFVLVLKGNLSQSMKYTLTFGLSAVAFLLSNIAIMLSAIYVQVN